MLRALIRFDTAASVAGWRPIDDVVMGGVSHSRLRADPEGFAWFEGVVALENGGGFASVRSPAVELGAPGATEYLVEVFGDGKRYRLSLRTDLRFDGIAYLAEFAPPPDVWTVQCLPVTSFRASMRGRPVPAAPPLDAAQVRQAGLMIAGRQAGAFALALRSIAAR